MLAQHVSTALRTFFSKKKKNHSWAATILPFSHSLSTQERFRPEARPLSCTAPSVLPVPLLYGPFTHGREQNEIAQAGWKGPSVLLASQHLGDLKDFSLYCIDSMR